MQNISEMENSKTGKMETEREVESYFDLIGAAWTALSEGKRGEIWQYS